MVESRYNPFPVKLGGVQIMEDVQPNKLSYFSRLPRLLFFAIGLSFLFWFLQTLADVYIFQEGNLFSQLFTLQPSEIWLIILVLGFLVSFGWYANHLLYKRGLIEQRLQASEERYRMLIELSPDAIAIQTEDRIVFINQAGARLFGADTLERLIGKSVWDFVEAEDRELIASRFLHMRDLETKVPPIEQTFVRLDGMRIEVEVTAAPLTYHGNPAILAIFRDITERKRMENEVRQRNKELSALNAIANTTSQSLELEEIISNSLEEVLKLETLGENAMGMLFLLNNETNSLSLVAQRGAPPDHPCLSNPPKLGECLCGMAAQKGETIISSNCWEDERHTRQWLNMPVHQDISIPLKARGKILGAMDVRLPDTLDITHSDIEMLESVAGQISMAIENARLRVMRQRAIIDERERIARELHDGLSQLLGYVNTKAMAVRLMLKNGQFGEADRHLSQLEEAAQGLFVDVRSEILGLRIIGQSSAGLIENIREYVEQFSRISGLSVEVVLKPDGAQINLPLEAELQVIRILQEALNNVYKHASTTDVIVSIKQNQDIFELTICDNGSGLLGAQSGASDQPRFGLSMMQERAQALGADLDITSEPGQGTTVMLRMEMEGQ